MSSTKSFFFFLKHRNWQKHWHQFHKNCRSLRSNKYFPRHVTVIITYVTSCPHHADQNIWWCILSCLYTDTLAVMIFVVCFSLHSTIQSWGGSIWDQDLAWEPELRGTYAGRCRPRLQRRPGCRQERAPWPAVCWLQHLHWWHELPHLSHRSGPNVCLLWLTLTVWGKKKRFPDSFRKDRGPNLFMLPLYRQIV